MKELIIININNSLNNKNDFLELKIFINNNNLDESIIENLIKDMNYGYNSDNYLIIVNNGLHKCNENTVESIINNKTVKRDFTINIFKNIKHFLRTSKINKIRQYE